MSTIDPLKPKAITLPPSPPPASSANVEKKKLDQSYVPPAPPLQVGGLFPSATSSTPGVSVGVFGAVSPDPTKLDDKTLAGKTQSLLLAMHKDPGKVTDYDRKIAAAFVGEMGKRAEAKLSAPVDATKYSNLQLFQQLVLLDLKKTGGGLSKAEADTMQKLEAEWKKRTTADPTKTLAAAEAKRAALQKEVALKCGSAAMTLASLSPTMEGAGLVTAGVMVLHDLHEGHYGEAIGHGLAEAASLALHKSPLGKGIKILTAVYDTAKCGIAVKELVELDKQIAEQKKAIAQ